MCQGAVSASEHASRFGHAFGARFASELARLRAFAEDGLVEIAADASLRVTPTGRLVLRNLAMVFDAYLEGAPADRARFSQTL